MLCHHPAVITSMPRPRPHKAYLCLDCLRPLGFGHSRTVLIVLFALDAVVVAAVVSDVDVVADVAIAPQTPHD